jgi:poly(beta-D-mannuronate) lyase
VKIPAKNKGCYFKAGAYTQSNPSKGDKVDAYSEVWIYKVDVTHTA